MLEREAKALKQVKKAGAQKASPKLRPTLTPEAREKRLMSLALDVAEQRLLDGTASSQLVTTILKISTEREKLEREILEKKRDLLVAQKESIESSKRIEELYAEAIEAMKRYSVRDGSEDEEYEEL